MDTQSLFNILAGIIIAIAGAYMKLLTSKIKDNETAVKENREKVDSVLIDHLPKKVDKDDFVTVVTNISTKLDRIYDKLEQKLDKNHDAHNGYRS